jgi:hypothetical protein
VQVQAVHFDQSAVNDVRGIEIEQRNVVAWTQRASVRNTV